MEYGRDPRWFYTLDKDAQVSLLAYERVLAEKVSGKAPKRPTPNPAPTAEGTPLPSGWGKYFTVGKG